MSQRKPGRVRKKLASMLSKALNVPCEPSDIWDNNFLGARQLDAARWGANLSRGRVAVMVYSHDLMSECVRHGLYVRQERDSASVEVGAQEA